MKPSKRTRVGIALITVASLVAAACGGDESSDSSTEGAQETTAPVDTSGSVPSEGTSTPGTEAPTDSTADSVAEAPADSAGETPATSAAEAPTEEPVRGGTMVMGVTGGPAGTNAAVAGGTSRSIPSSQIHASLVVMDNNYEPQPYLAESFEVSDDSLTWTFLLHDAVFHDGQPVTSEDVAFTIDVMKEFNPFRGMLKTIESVETPDATTVVINLSAPTPYLGMSLSAPFAPVLPKHIYGDGQDVRQHPRNVENPIGAGPFRVTEYVQGEILRLERFDDFFIDGLPYLDGLILTPITDPATDILAFERGEVDYFSAIDQVTVEKARGVPGALEITPADSGAGRGITNNVTFNTENEFLKVKEVRQAIAYAIDKNFIIDVFQGGVAERTPSVIPPGTPFHDATVNSYDYDVDKANELLDTAGFPRGGDGTRFSLTIDYVSAIHPDFAKGMSEYIAIALKEVGIQVEVLTTPDPASYGERLATGEFDMAQSLPFMWGDPAIGTHRLYTTDNIVPAPGFNNSRYSNPVVDDLLARAAVETDEDIRAELYAEFQQIVADDVPILPIGTLPVINFAAERVRDLRVNIWGNVAPLDTVWLAP